MCSDECCPPVPVKTIEERLHDHDRKIQSAFEEHKGLHEFVMGLASMVYAVEPMAAAMSEGEQFLAEYTRNRLVSRGD